MSLMMIAYGVFRVLSEEAKKIFTWIAFLDNGQNSEFLDVFSKLKLSLFLDPPSPPQFLYIIFDENLLLSSGGVLTNMGPLFIYISFLPSHSN